MDTNFRTVFFGEAEGIGERRVTKRAWVVLITFSFLGGNMAKYSSLLRPHCRCMRVFLTSVPLEIGHNFTNQTHHVDYTLEIIHFYDGWPQNPLIPLIILNRVSWSGGCVLNPSPRWDCFLCLMIEQMNQPQQATDITLESGFLNFLKKLETLTILYFHVAMVR